MNMNIVQVHTPNKTLGSKNSRLLVAGILMSSLLTACGGGGLSAEEQAAQVAAAVAKAAADEAAAAQVAAAVAKAAADQAAATAAAYKPPPRKQRLNTKLLSEAARKDISDAVTSVDNEAKSAQLTSSTAGYVALQAGQQGASYQEAAQSVAKTKAFAAQAEQEAAKAAAQKAPAARAAADAQGSPSLELLKQSVLQAQQAEKIAKEARIAAEKALEETQAAAQQVAEEVKIAEASRRYAKLDSGGNELSPSATSWSCVKDKNTG